MLGINKMSKLTVFSYMRCVKKVRKKINIQKFYPLHFKAEKSRTSNFFNWSKKAFFFVYRGFQLFDDFRAGCFLPLNLAHIALLGTHIIKLVTCGEYGKKSEQIYQIEFEQTEGQE